MTTATVGNLIASVYINGRPRSALGGDWIDSIDPATASLVVRVSGGVGGR
jgi:hypothetical protein